MSPPGTFWLPSAGRVGQRYILGNRNLSLAQFLDLVEQASGRARGAPAIAFRPAGPARSQARRRAQARCACL